MSVIACPAEGDHGASCLCNGSREVRISAASAFCPVCGDPETKKNLGFVACVDGVHTGAPCTECFTVGDPAELARRAAALRGAGESEPPIEPEPVADLKTAPDPEPSEPPPQPAQPSALRVVHRHATDSYFLARVSLQGYGEARQLLTFDAIGGPAFAALVIELAQALEMPLVEWRRDPLSGCDLVYELNVAARDALRAR